MTTYSITVILDPKWVRQFRNGKMNLCTSFSITSNYSKVAYNVIATHEGIVAPDVPLLLFARLFLYRYCVSNLYL